MKRKQKASTAEIASHEFRPHGVIQAEVIGNIVHYIARGPFNEELNTAYGELQKEFVFPKMASSGSWGDITTFVDSALESPSSLQEFSKVLHGEVRRGFAPTATAFVIGPSVEGAKLMGPIYADIYAKAGLTFKVFDDYSAALYWVEKQCLSATVAPKPSN